MSTDNRLKDTQPGHTLESTEEPKIGASPQDFDSIDARWGPGRIFLENSPRDSKVQPICTQRLPRRLDLMSSHLKALIIIHEYISSYLKS